MSDQPTRPSCWAFTRDAWRRGRVMSAQPFPGSSMGPGWDPGDPLVMVRTFDGYNEQVSVRHVIVAGDDGLWPPEPGEPPEDWEPGGGEPPAFLG